MKHVIYGIFMFVVLAMPVLAQAVSCNMEMDSKIQSTDCPHMNVQEKCDNLMLLADCLDVDKLAVKDATLLKVAKIDTIPMAVMLFEPNHSQVALLHSARAPPVLQHGFKQSYLILTTQRFRI